MTAATSTPSSASRVVVLHTISGKKCQLTPPLDVRHILQVAVTSFGFDETSVKIVIANHVVAIGQEADLADVPANDMAAGTIRVRNCLSMNIVELYNRIQSDFCGVSHSALLSRSDFERDSAAFEILVFGKTTHNGLALRGDSGKAGEHTTVARAAPDGALVVAPVTAGTTSPRGGDCGKETRATLATQVTGQQTAPSFSLLPYPHSPIGLQRLLEHTVQFETSSTPNEHHLFSSKMSADPTMTLIANQVRADPSTLEPIMRHIRQVVPDLFSWIRTHPETFLMILEDRTIPRENALREVASYAVRQLPLNILRHPRGFFIKVYRERLSNVLHIKYYYRPHPELEEFTDSAMTNGVSAEDKADVANDDEDVDNEAVNNMNDLELDPVEAMMYIINMEDVHRIRMASNGEVGDDMSDLREEQEEDKNEAGRATRTAQLERSTVSDGAKGPLSRSVAGPAATHVSTTVASSLSATGTRPAVGARAGGRGSAGARRGNKYRATSKHTGVSTASREVADALIAAADAKKRDMSRVTEAALAAYTRTMAAPVKWNLDVQEAARGNDDEMVKMLRHHTSAVAELLASVQCTCDGDLNIQYQVYAEVQMLTEFYMRLLQHQVVRATWPNNVNANLLNTLQLAHEHLARSEAFYLAILGTHGSATNTVVSYDAMTEVSKLATTFACETALARLLFLYGTRLIAQTTNGADATAKAHSVPGCCAPVSSPSPRPRVGALRQFPPSSFPLLDPVMRWICPDGPRRLLCELLEVSAEFNTSAVLWYSRYYDTQGTAHTVSYVLHQHVTAVPLDSQPLHERRTSNGRNNNSNNSNNSNDGGYAGQSDRFPERCLRRLHDCVQAGVNVPAVLKREWEMWSRVTYNEKVKPIESLIPASFASNAPLYVVDTSEAVAPWHTADNRDAALTWQAWSDTPRGVARFFAGLLDEYELPCLYKWPSVSATTPWEIVLACKSEERAVQDFVVRFATRQALPWWLPSAWRAHAVTAHAGPPRRALVAHLAYDAAEDTVADVILSLSATAASPRADERRWSSRTYSASRDLPSLVAAARTQTAPQRRSMTRPNGGEDRRCLDNDDAAFVDAALYIVDPDTVQRTLPSSSAKLLRTTALTSDGGATFYADLYATLCKYPTLPLAAAVREAVVRNVQRYNAPWLAVEFTLLNYGAALPGLNALFHASASNALAPWAMRSQPYLARHAVDDLYEMMLAHLLQTRPTGTVAVVNNLIAYIEQNKDALAAKASADKGSLRGHHRSVASGVTETVAPSTCDGAPLTPEADVGVTSAAATRTSNTKAAAPASSPRRTSDDPPHAGDDAEGGDGKATAPS